MEGVDLGDIIGQLGAFLAGLAALVGALKGWIDSRKFRRAGAGGSASGERKGERSRFGLTEDSEVGNIHFVVSNGKLFLRLLVAIALVIASWGIGYALNESMGGLPEPLIYVVLTFMALFALIALVCILRFAYRFLLFVFLR